MENLFHLLVQAIAQAAVLTIPLYFALPKPRTRLYPKLISVFVAAQIALSVVVPATGDPAKDWFQMIVGPMILAYLAGKLLFKHPTP